MQERKNSEQLFLTGMILTMTCWGFSWTSGKVLSQYADPLTIGFARFAFTVLSLYLILVLLREKISISRAGLVEIFFAGALLALYTWLSFKGLKEGLAGAGGVLVTVLNPIVAYGITIALARRRPTRNETIGLLMGLLAGGILLQIFTRSGDIMKAGNIYFFLAAVIWAIVSRFTARAAKFGSSVSYSFWLYFISTFILLLFSGYREPVLLLERADAVFWWNIFFTGTITTAIATTFYFYATAKVGASRASSFIFLVPFSAALGSLLFLGEKIQMHTIVGGLLGIAAVYILNVGGTKAKG